ncbi:unnamed protein product [Rhizoctonia solani]|nr:unnamed protein product [Rhizoctonia solani]
MPPRPLSVTFDRPLSPIVQSLGEVLEDISDDRTQLTPAEQAWSSNQYYLESNGFILRPRLRQGWTPSWQEAGDDPSNYEDSIRITELGIADAIRASDGAQVVLKAVRSVPATIETTLGRPDELGILRRLHAPPYTGHVCNHAVPLLGSMPMPCTTEGSIAVLPLLRVHDDPPFVSVGEAVEFMKQVLRGLAFMHAQNVAHRDIKPSNIMMAGEVLYDEPFHPVAQSLSLDAKSILRPHARHELDSHRRHDGESAVRYYYINFSRASYLPPEATTDGKSKSRLLRCSRGQLGRFPEAMLTTGHDPFKADVYCLGKYVIDGLITRHLALAPFTSVARYMTRRDPRTRPTAAEVFAHFETIPATREICIRQQSLLDVPGILKTPTHINGSLYNRVEVPETLLKKRKQSDKQREEKLAAALAARKARATKRSVIFKRAETYVKEYLEKEQEEIRLRRAARASGDFYIAGQPKVLFVVRIKGINKMAPKPRKILQLLRLLQINNGVFVKVTKATGQMLRLVEPYVTYGEPNLKTVRELIYKRGYAKINKQRVPLSDNAVIEKELGKFGIISIEDLVHEIITVGPNFKQASNFLWPFKLSNPTGGWRTRKFKHYVQGGDQGNREENINKLVRQMN